VAERGYLGAESTLGSVATGCEKSSNFDHLLSIHNLGDPRCRSRFEPNSTNRSTAFSQGKGRFRPDALLGEGDACRIRPRHVSTNTGHFRTALTLLNYR
jgi:hypothetical protein